MILRAPGFPAANALSLAAPAAAAATDRLAREVDLVEAARAAAIDALQRGPASKAVTKATKAMRRGELPTNADSLGDGAAPVEALVRADASRATAQQAAEQALEEEARVVAEFLNTIAAEPRFHEALLWQNRVAVHGSIASLLRRPTDANDSKTREHRRLVASCVQRYCVKNDTIGFFGPVGWARLGGANVIAVHPGEQLLARRTVYFEYWCIDALAQRLAQDPEQRPFLRPRRLPLVRLEGNTLFQQSGKAIELPSEFAHVLAALDGDRTARQIAEALGTDEAEVFDLLDELASKGLCSWAFEIPTATFHPESYLRSALEHTEGPARDRGLAALAQLEERRAAVGEAAGDPDRLDAALGALESTFEELTEASATRKGGETYAGRTLLYEDCRRDLEVVVGQAILDELVPALALVLDSARWYTHAIAARYEVVFREAYTALRRETAAPVEYLRYLERLRGDFPGPERDHGIAHDVAVALTASWHQILGIGDGDERQIQRTSGDLRGPVDAAFHAPAPGWPSARHHSPDIMIAAESVEAIRRGDYQLVLGELHVGLNTVTLPCLLKEHPDPEVLVRAREADLPGPGIAPVWSKARTRADFFSVSRHDYDLEQSLTRSTRPRDQVLAAGSLVIDDIDGRLTVHAREGGTHFHLVPFMEHHLIAESFSRFRLLGRRAHTPRVTIDKVIVQRETWRFTIDMVTFAEATTELARFLAARRFAERHGMPRLCYAKTDAEVKPFFVDFESPILIEILARQLKRSTKVVISEMSPGFAECWLPDGQGNRYTSELRLVATDPKPWTPS